MMHLAMLMFTLISATLMGVAIIAVLVAGYDTLLPVVAAAAVGFVAAIPVSWGVAKAMHDS